MSALTDETEVYIGDRLVSMPVGDYLEWVACQNGFEDYRAMYQAGVRVADYEDAQP